MSVQTQIDRIDGNVKKALAKIAEKGVTVASDANSDDLEALIAAIEAGGGSGVSFGDFDEATVGTFVPSEDISDNYAIDVGISYQNSSDSFVFVLYSAPAFTASGTKVNLQLVNVLVTENYNRTSSGGATVAYGAYLNSSGSIARATSISQVGRTSMLSGNSNVIGKPLAFKLICTVSKILPAGMRYYWFCGVKRA